MRHPPRCTDRAWRRPSRVVAALAWLWVIGSMPVWAAEPVLLIHGGAGTILRSDLDAVTEAAIRADLQTALRAGAEQLRSGADADAAVIAAIRVLEESARFNAGKGAVMDAEGGHQLDAAIMRGWNRQAGAVAGLRQTRSPIQAALAVMDHSPHVLLAGTDADAFATTQGLEQVSNDWFDTDFRRGQCQQGRGGEDHAAGAVTQAGVVGGGCKQHDGGAMG